MSVRKALRTSLPVLFMGVAAAMVPALAPIARADEPQRAGVPAAGVSEDARAAISRMSKTLQAKQFSFDARTLRAYVGPNGELLHIAHAIKTEFRRPDRLRVEATGDDGSIQMLFDGKAVVLYGVEQKKYARIPATNNDLDEALALVAERTGTDFPLADLLSNDPERSLLSGVSSGGEVGTALIDRVSCRHFFFSQAADDLDFELWLEDNDKSLPRRMVVTYRALPGRPNFLAEMSNWNFSVQLPDSDFEFKPPAGVAEADLQPKSSGSSTPAK